MCLQHVISLIREFTGRSNRCLTQDTQPFRASFRNFLKGGGGAKLSLVPSPSLSVRREAHSRGRKKKVLVSTVCAYVGFNET